MVLTFASYFYKSSVPICVRILSNNSITVACLFSHHINCFNNSRSRITAYYRFSEVAIPSLLFLFVYIGNDMGDVDHIMNFTLSRQQESEVKTLCIFKSCFRISNKPA